MAVESRKNPVCREEVRTKTRTANSRSTLRRATLFHLRSLKDLLYISTAMWTGYYQTERIPSQRHHEATRTVRGKRVHFNVIENRRTEPNLCPTKCKANMHQMYVYSKFKDDMLVSQSITERIIAHHNSQGIHRYNMLQIRHSVGPDITTVIMWGTTWRALFHVKVKQSGLPTRSPTTVSSEW